MESKIDPMWSKQKTVANVPPAAYSQRMSKYIDRDFQIKFTKYILIVAVVSGMAFLIPTLYFINQNYDIFVNLADSFSPDIADHIAREQVGFNLIFSIFFFANIIFWVVFTRNMTAKIVGPAKILRNHLRLLSRGDLSLPPVKIREDDEFQELVQTYNYFYSLIRVQNERELTELKKVKEQVINPTAHQMLQKIIKDREDRAS